MSYTYTKQESNDLKREGDYEVYIEDIGVKTLPSGTEKLGIQFRIRTDVEQDYKNGVIFEDIWHEKQEPQYFNRRRINQLLGTQDIEENTTFDGINDICKFLKGCKLCVHLVIEHSDYLGKDVNAVKYYKSTQAKEQTLGSAASNNEPEDITNLDELPF